MTRFLVFGVLGVFLVGGCGGGSPLETSEKEMESGLLTTRATGSIPNPVVMTGTTATVTGLAGANFTLARLNLPPATQLNRDEVLASTQIAFSRQGRPWILDVATSNAYPVNPASAPFTTNTPPSLSPAGDRVFSSEWDTDNTYQIFSTLIDGTGRIRLTTGSDALYPAVSPDGTKVAFTRFFGSAMQIWTVPAAGGSPTRLTNETSDCRSPQWSPDGTKIAFIRDVGPFRDLFVMNASGSGLLSMISPPTADTTILGFDWAPWGTEIAAAYVTGSGTISIATGMPGGTYRPPLYTTGDSVIGLTWSPDGSRLAFTKGLGSSANVFSMPATGGAAPTKLTSIGDTDGPNWGFYVRQRTLIGNGGGMSGTGAGFLFSQVGQRVPAFCVFDATTRTTATIESQTTGIGSPHLIAMVRADALTMFRYANHLFGPSTSVISSGSTVSGVLVTFNGGSGLITNVMPFIGSTPVPMKHSDATKYKGSFLGVWDSDGRQRAGSTSTVSIDHATGHVTYDSFSDAR